jgi:hypothetical protein
VKKSAPIAVCATCPWLKGNQGQPHPAGWYRLSNLKRLWDGLRTGKAPGMICHATDAEGVDYGSTKAIPATVQRRECAGALILRIRHANEAGACHDLKEYQARHRYPMTRGGLLTIVNRSLDPFNHIPPVTDNAEVQLPWRKS